jgi:hypothetical protein
LREIVRGKADAALRQIEAEIEPHRTAQPRIGAAFRRPGAFDQAAEHDTIAFGQARFEQAENADAQTRPQRAADDAAAQRGGEKFDVVRCSDGETCCRRTRREFVERCGKF